MVTQSGADLCRVTLAAPRVRLDVALPATVPLAGLLPALLGLLGEDAVEEGAAQGGWLLQRVGESPLDLERNLTALGIRDGEVLYVRPRQDALPAVAFDDPVDAIGTALRDGGLRWSQAATSATALAAAAVLGLAASASALLTGPPWTWSAVACAVTAVLLTGAGALVSRAYRPAAGTALTATATGFAFVAGLLALAGTRTLGRLAAPQLLLGVAAALVAAVAGAVALNRVEAVLSGITAAAVLSAAGVLTAMATDAVAGAAVAVTAALALTPLAPRLAYRAAGLPPPALPLTAEELRGHGEPLSGEDITRRALAADRALTALAGATGAVAAGCAAVMLAGRAWTGDEWAATVMCGICAVLLVLRARLFAGLAQRLWLLGSGLAVLAGLAVRLTSWFGPPAMLLVLLFSLAATGTVLAWAVKPELRVAAPWARVSDIAELLVTLALVPLALQLLHAYSAVRALSG